MCARTHFEIFDKNLILHSKFQKKSMLMTLYRLLSHRKWLSIRYWGMLRNALLWGPWSLKFRHLLNRWPWPNIVGCHYCCGPTKPPILDLFAITQYSILSHNKLLSIEYWVLKDTESLYFTISTLCIGDNHHGKGARAEPYFLAALPLARRSVGHTAWAPEGREGRSQGAQRAPN